ncbi:MAG: hypothetical protein HLUCCA08_15830 [Rhodobacteraceae bacterium HLUCCA08]|nr:MAG: hypothetical protein HLUCCA08_15830 [Rhodobacteraceae bacterium HLUCCA08]
MALRPRRSEFLERRSYRQRRMRDAGRILPVFALVFCLLPLIWPRQGGADGLTSTGLMYLFGLWIVLIVLAAALSRVLRDDETRTNGDADKDRLR